MQSFRRHVVVLLAHSIVNAGLAVVEHAGYRLCRLADFFERVVARWAAAAPRQLQAFQRAPHGMPQAALRILGMPRWHRPRVQPQWRHVPSV